jgi:nucleoside-diphosphate-sugar epimerase
VTGAAGYIGSVLVKKLIQSKVKFKSYVDNNIKVENDKHLINYDNLYLYDNLMYKQLSLIDYCYKKDVHFIQGDVRNEDLLLEYIEKSDIIIPLAAIVGAPACDKDKNLAYEVNERQIEFIVKNAKNKKIIIPTTNSMYGTSKDIVTEKSEINPLSYYAKTKVNAEKFVIDYGGISLRLATVFGISQKMRLDLLINNFVYKAITDKYIVLFEAHFKRNFIHIQDVALAFIFMINNYEKNKGEIFNLGLSNANLSKLELCLRIKELIPNFSINLDNINEDPDKRDYIVSNEKIELIGWKPHYSIEDGIEELIKAYKIIINNNSKFTNL